MKNMKWILIAMCVQTAVFANSDKNSSIETYLLSDDTGTVEGFEMSSASDEQKYKVTCPNSTVLTASSADNALAGDHWQLTINTEGAHSVLGVVSSSGVYNEFRSVTVDQFDAPALTAIATVKYLHGIDNFPASGLVKFKCDQGEAIVETLKK